MSHPGDSQGNAEHARLTETFRRVAPRYDRWTRAFAAPLQRRAIALLELRSGNVVLDVGCGTGQAFSPLEAAIGRSGRIVGIDLSGEMLARAAARIEHNGWQNVTLIESAVDEASIPVPADAALLSFVPDVMQSRPALANVLEHLMPGGRIVAVGPRRPPQWNLPARLAMRGTARIFGVRYVDQPWKELQALTSELNVRLLRLGAIFVASGNARPQTASGPAR